MAYFGGKNGNGTYQNIINKIPPHNKYIELFLGGGGIMNNKLPATINYGVEINPGTIDQFNYNGPAIIFLQDVFEWLDQHWTLLDKDTFVYLDPPYPINSRKNKVPVYEYELTDQQHVDLLKLVKSMPAMVGISTYPNDLYKTELAGWNLHTFESMTRKGMATEHYYFNYPEPTELHDYRYLGKDFTDRQRIKRKITREITKLSRLPVLERQAIINAIASDIK